MANNNHLLGSLMDVVCDARLKNDPNYVPEFTPSIINRTLTLFDKFSGEEWVIGSSRACSSKNVVELLWKEYYGFDEPYSDEKITAMQLKCDGAAMDCAYILGVKKGLALLSCENKSRPTLDFEDRVDVLESLPHLHVEYDTTCRSYQSFDYRVDFPTRDQIESIVGSQLELDPLDKAIKIAENVEKKYVGDSMGNLTGFTGCVADILVDNGVKIELGYGDAGVEFKMDPSVDVAASFKFDNKMRVHPKSIFMFPTDTRFCLNALRCDVAPLAPLWNPEESVAAIVSGKIPIVPPDMDSIAHLSLASGLVLYNTRDDPYPDVNSVELLALHSNYFYLDNLRKKTTVTAFSSEKLLSYSRLLYYDFNADPDVEGERIKWIKDSYDTSEDLLRIQQALGLGRDIDLEEMKSPILSMVMAIKLCKKHVKRKEGSVSSITINAKEKFYGKITLGILSGCADIRGSNNDKSDIRTFDVENYLSPIFAGFISSGRIDLEKYWNTLRSRNFVSNFIVKKNSVCLLPILLWMAASNRESCYYVEESKSDLVHGYLLVAKGSHMYDPLAVLSRLKRKGYFKDYLYDVRKFKEKILAGFGPDSPTNKHKDAHMEKLFNIYMPGVKDKVNDILNSVIHLRDGSVWD